MQNIVLVIFPKQFFFSVLYFERKTSTLWGKLLRKTLSFSFFVCRGHLVLFVPENVFLSDCVRANLLASTKDVSAVFSKVHSDCAEERSSCFFLKKTYQSSRTPNKFFSQFEIKTPSTDQRKCKVLVQRNNLVMFPNQTFT